MKTNRFIDIWRHRSELPVTIAVSTFKHHAKVTQIVRRFGSAILAVLLPFLGLLIEGLIMSLLNIHFEIARAAVSVACIALLIHSGFRQREYSRSRWEFSFWIALLGVPMLGATWLGLNVIRSYLYPDYWTDSKVARWELVCTLQLWDQRAAVVLAIAAALLGLAILVSRAYRHSAHA